MDVKTRLSHADPATRAALVERIRARHRQSDTGAEYDVVVVGGGTAALTLALQLAAARPATRIGVVEPVRHPVAEITHTVGESTVEVSAHYLRETLGLGEHLQTSQLRKMGLRMFFSDGDNGDIAARLELGGSRFVPQATYQIDRGRLDNELHRRCVAAGVAIVHGRVRSVTLAGDPQPHTVVVQRGEEVVPTTARWVVDASGRNRALPRQLDLKVPTGHHCNAAWLRVATEIDVNAWSDDAQWHRRVVEGDRAMSTNHLMGEGYWVWLIRLASGATSVGIVADPAVHPFDTFNTLGKAQAWLADHEPQCAAVIAADPDAIRDFRVMKHYSHTASQVYDGARRWCLTGDAGVFLDPLYSSGLDLVAIGNGLITDMVVRELDGEDVASRAHISDSLFRSLTGMWLAVYQDQYTLMGKPAVMAAKVVWDIAFYWGVIGFLYVNGRYVRIADDPGVVARLDGLIALSNRVQRFFREWAAVDDVRAPTGFLDSYAPLNFMVTLHTAMIGASARFDDQFDDNTTLLRQLAGQLVDTVVDGVSGRFDDDAAVAQLQAWQRDALLRDLRQTYRRRQREHPLGDGWIVRAAPALPSRPR